MYPHFICIGAQRAGTTWFHECLAEHPQIFMPDKKELQFFNAFYENGMDWYQSHFESCQSHQICGEVTPNYLGISDAIDRMYESLPTAKIIVILRNPFQRTFSAYQLFKDSRFPDLDLESACTAHPYLVNQSLYADAIHYVLSRYPREQVLIAQYDQIENDPNRFLAAVFDFIGVDSDFVPSQISKRYNKVIYPRLQKTLIKFGLGFVIELVKSTLLGDILRRRSVKNGSSDKSTLFSPRLRDTLNQDIDKTAVITGLSLSHWKC